MFCSYLCKNEYIQVPKHGIDEVDFAPHQAVISLVMPRDFVIPLARNKVDQTASFRVIAALSCFPQAFLFERIRSCEAVFSRPDLHMRYLS